MRAKKKSKQHLKFTLFPFVSILLAVVGVLLFLTMVQAVILKAESEKNKKEDPRKVIYERLPELNTHTFEFSGNEAILTIGEEKLVSKSSTSFNELFRSIHKNLIQVNMEHAKEERNKREHLLYVVHEDGVDLYFEFLDIIQSNFDSTSRIRSPKEALENFMIIPKGAGNSFSLNPYLPVGLTMLAEGETLELR